MVIVDVRGLQLPPKTLNVTTTIILGPSREKICLDFLNGALLFVLVNGFQDIEGLN